MSAASSSSKNPFGSGGAVERRDGAPGSTSTSSAVSLTPPPLPRRSGSPFQSAESQLVATPRGRSEFSSSSSAGGSAGAAALEAVLVEAVGLLQQAGRAVAALDDAYNAAYNASAAADGWGGQGHDVAELGEVSEAEEPPDAAGFLVWIQCRPTNRERAAVAPRVCPRYLSLPSTPWYLLGFLASVVPHFRLAVYIPYFICWLDVALRMSRHVMSRHVAAIDTPRFRFSSPVT